MLVVKAYDILLQQPKLTEIYTLFHFSMLALKVQLNKTTRILFNGSLSHRCVGIKQKVSAAPQPEAPSLHHSQRERLSRFWASQHTSLLLLSSGSTAPTPGARGAAAGLGITHVNGAHRGLSASCCVFSAVLLTNTALASTASASEGRKQTSHQLTTSRVQGERVSLTTMDLTSPVFSGRNN